ncbi:hypothetical protein ABPG77_004749 [Micractinium sp. CCAP 211/92]
MPPRQRKRGGGEEEDVFTLEAEAGAESKKAEERLNLDDGPSLKRALDEAVIEALTNHGLLVDHTYTDFKIALGLGCCGLALLAQFYPKKYPANFWLLLGCVAAYVVLSTLMTVVASVFEKDAILLTKGGGPKGAPPLAVSSKLPRFGTKYTLSIVPRGAAAAGDGASLSKSIGQYFHSNGFLAKDVVTADAVALLQQFLEGKSK